MLVEADDLRLFASAVAKLHRCPIVAPPLTVTDQLARGLHPAPRVISQQYPELASSIDYVLDTAIAIGQEFGDDVYTFTHGDLTLDQVHIKDGEVWILDLDHARCADPAYDLAQFYVFLKRAARKKRRSEYVESLRTAFLEGYFSQMDRQIALRVPLHEGLLHLKRAVKCFRVQDDDWYEQMKRLVGQSVACLQVMESSKQHLNRGEPSQARVVQLYDSCPGAF